MKEPVVKPGGFVPTNQWGTGTLRKLRAISQLRRCIKRCKKCGQLPLAFEMLKLLLLAEKLLPPGYCISRQTLTLMLDMPDAPALSAFELPTSTVEAPTPPEVEVSQGDIESLQQWLREWPEE